MTNLLPARVVVDQAIVEVVLPQAYYYLDTMITHLANGTKPDKRDLMEARKLLPNWADNTLTR